MAEYCSMNGEFPVLVKCGRTKSSSVFFKSLEVTRTSDSYSTRTREKNKLLVLDSTRKKKVAYSTRLVLEKKRNYSYSTRLGTIKLLTRLDSYSRKK